MVECEPCEQEYERYELCDACDACDECCDCHECHGCLENIPEWDPWCADCDNCLTCCVCDECCVHCGQHDTGGGELQGEWYCQVCWEERRFRCPGCGDNSAYVTAMDYSKCPHCDCVYRREPNLMGWSLHEAGLGYMGPFPNFISDEEMYERAAEEEAQKKIQEGIQRMYAAHADASTTSPTEETQEAQMATTHVYNRNDILVSLEDAKATIEADIQLTKEYNEQQEASLLAQITDALEVGKFTTNNGKEIDVSELKAADRIRAVSQHVDSEVPVYANHRGVDNLITLYRHMDGDTVELDHDEWNRIERVINEMREVEAHIASIDAQRGDELRQS